MTKNHLCLTIRIRGWQLRRRCSCRKWNSHFRSHHDALYQLRSNWISDAIKIGYQLRSKLDTKCDTVWVRGEQKSEKLQGRRSREFTKIFFKNIFVKSSHGDTIMLRQRTIYYEMTSAKTHDWTTSRTMQQRLYRRRVCIINMILVRFYHFRI